MHIGIDFIDASLLFKCFQIHAFVFYSSLLVTQNHVFFPNYFLLAYAILFVDVY